MVRTNPGRNAIVYSLWEQGKTVDQISFFTGVPRSTVGYYVRKFNKYAKDGRSVVIPQIGREDKSGLLTLALNKSIMLGMMIDLMKSGKLEEAYYRLSIWKLLVEMGLMLTPEEIGALQEAFLGTQLQENRKPSIGERPKAYDLLK